MNGVAAAVVGGVELASLHTAHANAAESGGVDVGRLLEEVALEGLPVLRDALVKRLKVGLVLYQIGVGLSARAAEQAGVDGGQRVELHQAVVVLRQGHEHLARVCVLHRHRVACYLQAGRLVGKRTAVVNLPVDSVLGRNLEGGLHLGHIVACLHQHRGCANVGAVVAVDGFKARIEAFGECPCFVVVALEGLAAGHLCRGQLHALGGGGHYGAHHLLVVIHVVHNAVAVGLAIHAHGAHFRAVAHLAHVEASHHLRQVGPRHGVTLAVGCVRRVGNVAHYAAHVGGCGRVEHYVAVVAVFHVAAIAVAHHAAYGAVAGGALGQGRSA